MENRVAIARCATSGVSLFIDRYGRTRERTQLGAVDVRTGEVGLRGAPTLYTRFGDWFAVTNLMLAVLLAAGTWWRSRRSGSAAVPEGPDGPATARGAGPAQEPTGGSGTGGRGT